jgi:Caspase domain
MKIKFSFFFLLFAFLALGQPQKHALFVGIERYPKNSSWSYPSASNDVQLYKEILKKNNFFSEHFLMDTSATKNRIISALETLEKEVKKGDFCMFVFCGHGQQVQDVNQDEADCYDESIVPYNAKMYYTPDYQGQNHITDDELSTYLTSIRKKLGKTGSLLVILDACHSGTGTRDVNNNNYRGTSVIMASEDYIKAHETKKCTAKNDAFFENSTDAELAPMIALFGSQASQENKECRAEGKSYGSLSYAFYKIMKYALPNLTYKELFHGIKLQMQVLANQQTPEAEGLTDNLVFNGIDIKNVSQQWQPNKITVYFNVSDTKLLSELKSRIDINLTSDKKNADIIFEQNDNNIVKSYANSIENENEILKMDNRLIDNIVLSISRYARLSYIKSLEYKNDPAIQVSFKLMLYKKYENDEFIEHNGTITHTDFEKLNNMKVGTFIQFLVKNEGKERVYCNILDIMKPDTIKTLLSMETVEPGQSKILNGGCMVSLPYGNEQYKLIATKEPSRVLNGIFDEQGERTVDSNFSLKYLLLDSYLKDSTRSTDTFTPNATCIKSIAFRVVP